MQIQAKQNAAKVRKAFWASLSLPSPSLRPRKHYLLSELGQQLAERLETGALGVRNPNNNYEGKQRQHQSQLAN